MTWDKQCLRELATQSTKLPKEGQIMPFHNAHAAKVNEDGVVEQVIVIPYCNDDDAEVTVYCNRIGLAGKWLDTSYLGARRGKYAGVGDRYDAELDEFVSPVVQSADTAG